VTTLPYIFMRFDVASPPPAACILVLVAYFKYFWGAVICTCILNTFEIMYLYLYFKYFFGSVLVLVLKILLKSILPITDYFSVNCAV